jgi:large subunit ribosomal protein L27
MAHTKTGGKARQHSQRSGKRLGVKIFGGQTVKTGQIIVRQRGSKFRAGEGTKLGRDFTLFAMRDGKVQFGIKAGRKFVSITK